MKLVGRLVYLGALLITPLSAACGHPADNTAVGNDDLTSTLGVGTYLVDTPPFGSTYVERLTFAAGQKFEAQILSSSGDTTLLAGSYVILPARPNDPQSPVASDKPTLVLSSDSGGGDVSFELDRLSGGTLRLYESARQVSFTMTKDPSWQPAPTNRKVIACTGNTANAKLTLDQAQNRRGTLEITRKAAADRHDPPSVSVTITENVGSQVPHYVYFEGQHGEQDYYVNMNEDDFKRGSGNVTLNLQWAQGGQQWSVGVSCAFAR